QTTRRISIRQLPVFGFRFPVLTTYYYQRSLLINFSYRADLNITFDRTGKTAQNQPPWPPGMRSLQSAKFLLREEKSFPLKIWVSGAEPAMATLSLSNVVQEGFQVNRPPATFD